MKIQGIYAAVATPFDHTGAMYRVKVQHNFEKWSRTSLAGFIVGSLPGEGPLLDAEEKLELLRLAAPQIPPDRAVIADVSHEGVHAAVKLARAAAEAGSACGGKLGAASISQSDVRAGDPDALLPRAGGSVSRASADS